MKKEKPFELAIGDIIDFKIQSTLERGKEHQVYVKVSGKGKYIFWTLLLINPFNNQQWWVDNNTIDLAKNGGKKELKGKVYESTWYFPIFANAPLGEYTAFLGMYQDTYNLPTVNRRLVDYRIKTIILVKNPSEKPVKKIPSSPMTVAGIRSEQEDFEILRDRIIWCICHNLTSNNRRTFHGADMIAECAKAFYDKKGIEQYKSTGKHEYYTPILDKIYKPLVDGGLIEEYEKNNYRIPKGSRLEITCKTQLSDGRAYMKWNEIDWG